MATKSFSIEAVFKAIDRMSNPLKGMSRNTNQFSRALRTDFAKAQRQVDKFSRNLKQKLGRGLRTVMLGIGLAAVAGLGLAAKEFVAFEQAVTSASAKFGPAFQKGTEGFEQLQDAARGIGATTEFSATQAAEGLDFLALAGFSAEQAMSLLPGVVDLATASATDLATASDIASDSLGAFGLMSEDSAQLGLNLARTMDVMARTTTTSNTDLTTLFETVKKGAASFTAAGQSLESFNALAGVMANAGVKGAEAGTSLRNVMLKLANPTGEAENLLKSLGVVTADSEGNFRDIVDILADVENGLVGMGTQQRTAALATIFGARTVTGINVLLAEGSDSLRTYRDQLEGATGAASEMATTMRGSLQNQLATLKSAALELGFKFIEAFQEKGAGAISKLTELVSNFDPTPIIDGISKGFTIVSKFANVVKNLAPLILTVVGALALYKAIMIGSAIATAILTNAVAVFRAIQFIMIAVTQGMTAAQAALNGVMMANPIGLIIVAIAILIGLTILIIKNWDKVKEFFIKMWEGIKLAFKVAVDFMKGVMFTFADILLTTYGNIFKAIIIGAKKVGEFFGFDTSGLDNVINKINEVQATVRAESFIGGRESEADRIRAEREAPIGGIERSVLTREEAIQRSEVTIRDETGRAEITNAPSGPPSSLNLQQSGAF